MSTPDTPSPDPYRSYTISEAIEIMKLRERYTTNPMEQPIKWVDSKTKKPVIIGYSS